MQEDDGQDGSAEAVGDQDAADVNVEAKFEVPKTELGFAGELGFGGTAGLSPDLPDWLIPVFEVPITALGFPGEFGFGGTEGVPAAPPA